MGLTYLVHVGDMSSPEVAEEWAKDNCSSFISANTIDVSDFSQWDYISEFIFADEADAFIFRLRWK